MTPLVVFGLGALATLTSCQKQSQPAVVPAPPPAVAGAAPAVAKPGPSASPRESAAKLDKEHALAGHRIQIVVEDNKCLLLVRAATPADAPVRRLELALAPPCHLLLWQRRPPARAGGPSDGVAVGDVGAPIAWRYPSAQNATVVAVIGDPLSDQQKADPIISKRIAQGLRCAPGMQGVRLTSAVAQLTKKRDGTSVTCVEGGADERVFWMLAHD